MLDLDGRAHDPDQMDGVGEVLAPGDLLWPLVRHPLVLVLAMAARAPGRERSRRMTAADDGHRDGPILPLGKRRREGVRVRVRGGEEGEEGGGGLEKGRNGQCRHVSLLLVV